MLHMPFLTKLGFPSTAAGHPSSISPHPLPLPSTTPTNPPPPLTSAHHIEKTCPMHCHIATPHPTSHITTQQHKKAITRRRKHSKCDGKDRKRVEHNSQRIQGTPAAFFYEFLSNYTLAYHYHPQPPGNEHDGLFSGGITSYLATTTPENECSHLFSGRLAPPRQPLSVDNLNMNDVVISTEKNGFMSLFYLNTNDVL
jgi:hypothetical protein